MFNFALLTYYQYLFFEIMSNTIDNYKKEVKLIEAILARVNVTQSKCVNRIYEKAFVLNLLGDQTFFEFINWYVKKCINIAIVRLLHASRNYDFVKIRFWNSVITVLTPLLGEHPTFEIETMINELDDYDVSNVQKT